MSQKQRYTAAGKPATATEPAVAERQPFIDRVAASNPEMTINFQALGEEVTYTDKEGNTRKGGRTAAMGGTCLRSQ